MINDTVAKILELHLESREDDRILYQFYLVYEYGGQFKDNCIPLDIIAKAPNMDTLGRVRRFLQSKGNYPSTTRTKTTRRKREVEHANHYRNTK